VEVLGLGGTTRYLVLFVMELKTRATEIAGIHVNPGGEWMKQMARNLTDRVDGFLQGAKYLIHDQDRLFTEVFAAIFGTRGVECVKLPAQSPNCNPYAERFVKTIRYECLNHFICFGEPHLRYVVKVMAHPTCLLGRKAGGSRDRRLLVARLPLHDVAAAAAA
jgi:putative transposase